MIAAKSIAKVCDMFVQNIERRGSARYMCRLEGKCQPVTAVETGNTWPLEAVDVSVGGIGLRLARRFEPGTLLAMSLFGNAVEPVRMVLARVRRVFQSGNYWLLGCAWTNELDTTELRSLLGTPSRWQRTPVNGCKVLRLDKTADKPNEKDV
jgi:hypothetical protein